MWEDASAYFKNLRELFLKVAVTDSNNKQYDLSTGIEKAISLIVAQTAKGNKVLFIGNGGSAAIASHMTIDFWKNGNMKTMCFNDGAQLTCLGNDYGYQYVFEKPINMYAEKGDILIAISSSGKSDNILRAVSAAKDKQCYVITMSGFTANNPLRSLGADLNFYVPNSLYGFVEIIHQAICHCILDLIIERRNIGEEND